MSTLTLPFKPQATRRPGRKFRTLGSRMLPLARLRCVFLLFCLGRSERLRTWRARFPCRRREMFPCGWAGASVVLPARAGVRASYLCIGGLAIQRGPRNFSKFWAVPIFLKSNVSRSFTKTVLSWHFVHVARRGRQGRRGEDLGPRARPPTHAPSLASTSSTAPPPVARIAAISISPMAKSVWCALQTVSIDTLQTAGAPAQE